MKITLCKWELRADDMPSVAYGQNPVFSENRDNHLGKYSPLRKLQELLTPDRTI